MTREGGDGRVDLYVTSTNTRYVTEVCLRTIAKYTDRSRYRLIVGDNGSTDGSLPMLLKMRAAGQIDELEILPGGMPHCDWINKWTLSCEADVAVVLDSDVEILRADWLELLLAPFAAHATVLSVASIVPEMPSYVDYTGVPRRLAERGCTWVMAFRPEPCRAIDEPWSQRMLPDPAVPEGLIGMDTGAYLYQQLADRPGAVVEADAAILATFRHYGGMSWTKAEPRFPTWAMRAKRAKTFLLAGVLAARAVQLRAATLLPARQATSGN